MSEEQARSFIEQATQSLQSGQLNQALDFANQAIMLDPSKAGAYVIKAVALAQLNQASEASRVFEEAIRLQPDDPKTRFNFAVHLMRQNQKMEALTQVQESLRVDPSHAGARDMLAQLERDLGIMPEARPSEQAPPPIQAPPEQAPGTPYGQNPYGSPYAQPSPYLHPQQSFGRSHNVAFVERMGQTWDVIGWCLVGLYLLIFIVQVPQMMESIRLIMETGGRVEPEQNPVLQMLGFVGAISALTWMIIDIVDRRTSWLWLVLFCLCCCCGPVQALYMALGRKQQ